MGECEIHCVSRMGLHSDGGWGGRAVERRELKMIKILSLVAWEKMLLIQRWKQGNRTSLKK